MEFRNPSLYGLASAWAEGVVPATTLEVHPLPASVFFRTMMTRSKNVSGGSIFLFHFHSRAVSFRIVMVPWPKDGSL